MKTIAKITLRRGSGRRIKRHQSVSREALFYAVACGIFAQQLANKSKENRADLMTRVSQESAQILLTFSQQQIEEWLFDNLLMRGGK